ncbi:MAG TPA: hypothetical protein VLE95_05715 [Chlamydiales bacterium]|nr:hypothetical protein [Chlamydiales bacterium]
MVTRTRMSDDSIRFALPRRMGRTRERISGDYRTSSCFHRIRPGSRLHAWNRCSPFSSFFAPTFLAPNRVVHVRSPYVRSEIFHAVQEQPILTFMLTIFAIVVIASILLRPTYYWV